MPTFGSETSAAPAHVDVLGLNGETTRIAMSASPMIIGRVAECAIRLDHPMVSRQHARLELKDGRWRIADLKSHNGIKLNKKAVHYGLLSDGDLIEIGPFSLTFHHRAGPTARITTEHAEAPRTLNVNETAVTIRSLGEIQPPLIAVGHLNGLDEFSRLLMETPDAGDRLTALCRLMVQPGFGGKWSAVVSVDRAGGESPPEVVSPLQFAEGAKQGSGRGHGRDHANPYLSRSLLQAACRREEPVLASNASGSGGRDIALSMAPEVMQICAIAVPLPASLSGDSSRLDLLYAVFPPEYGTGEWLALSSLAVNHYRQAETIWANIERNRKLAALQADLERARVVQDRLVPRQPQLAGLEIAVRFKPCHAVGGDYVDVLPLPDGRALLVVADVCGKGLPAAMVGMGLHTLVHAAARRWAGLGDLALAVTAHLNETLSAESFVTFIGMTLDPATGAVEVVNGGHPASLIVDSAGIARRFGEATSLPLGSDPTPPEVEHGILGEGDTMLLFTDGCFELMNESGQMLGVGGFCQRAAEQIAANAVDADAAADRLTDDLDRLQADQPPSDDRTLLLVRRRAATG
jgi:serine phosphatase RsbU (regulator of sigma subunit)/pSer/pThr/pTyr-binding forkhead associated (FHA) protein